MSEISFTVMGRPQQKGSKQVVRNPGSRRGWVLLDMNPNARQWATQVSATARGAYQGPLIRDGVMVTAYFFFARPRSHFGTGRNQHIVKSSSPPRMISTPDLDKLCRATLDALTGVIFKDDAQIVRLATGKEYGEPARAEITVRVLGGDW